MLLSLTRLYPVAAGLWAVIWGLVVLFQVNTNSLWQEIVPDRLLGRVQSIVLALAWSAIPLGALIGGVAIERNGNVALVYGAIGALITLSALAFYIYRPRPRRTLPAAKGVVHRSADGRPGVSGRASRG